MRLQQLRHLILLLETIFLCTSPLLGQVTIGSSASPVSGALLQLKENDSIQDNSTKGLLLPRVKLTDLYNLYPMFAEDIYYKKNIDNKKEKEDSIHTGLVVYNTDDCSLYGFGVYVWNGEEWTILENNATLKGLNVDKTFIEFASGYDARPMTPKTVTVNWGISPATWTTGPAGSENIDITGIPAGGTLSNSPQTITLLADPIAKSRMKFPFNQSTLKLTVQSADCGGQTKEVYLLQMNYAIAIGDSVGHRKVFHDSKESQLPIQTNVDWVVTVAGSLKDQVVIPKYSGTSTETPYFEYTLPKNTRKYNNLDFFFVDKYKGTSAQRAKDLTVNLYVCDGVEPTVDEWVTRAGFTAAEAELVTDAMGNSSRITNNGIQLHRDQDQNLFMSGDFGVAGRWMLMSLRAKTFAPAGSRTGDDKTILAEMGTIPTKGMDMENNIGAPLWCYPHKEDATNSALYDSNYRIGLFYNWAAVTNSRGGATGQLIINDGENVTGVTRPKIQGICPNGWHVPNDVEWTALEKEIETNASRYSNKQDGDPNSVQTVTTTALSTPRGTVLAGAMADVCPINPLVSSYGESHVMNAVDTYKPGMQVLYLGNYMPELDRLGNYGKTAFFSSSSASSANFGWSRQLTEGLVTVSRSTLVKSTPASVRCIQD